MLGGKHTIIYRVFNHPRQAFFQPLHETPKLKRSDTVQTQPQAWWVMLPSQRVIPFLWENSPWVRFAIVLILQVASYHGTMEGVWSSWGLPGMDVSWKGDPQETYAQNSGYHFGTTAETFIFGTATQNSDQGPQLKPNGNNSDGIANVHAASCEKWHRYWHLKKWLDLPSLTSLKKNGINFFLHFHPQFWYKLWVKCNAIISVSLKGSQWQAIIFAILFRTPVRLCSSACSTGVHILVRNPSQQQDDPAMTGGLEDYF